jgi:ATP-binding cassette subfamily B protein
MQEFVCDHVTYLTSDLAGIEKYITFMMLPERGGKDSEFIENKDLIFNNVSLSYPSSKSAALSNISFQIKKKETIAIVGENGSGKSTLVRLLLGLYTPTEGDVFIGNMNTKEASLKSLVNPVSAVFQKFQKYQLSLKDNITISDPKKHLDYNMLNYLLDQSGLDLNTTIFENGYNTILSREFDGADLSGGIWQRIAIARGYYKEHEIIVLDEPTAAIDPIEETRIYQQFAEICKDKTAILVTHRLGSAKIADRIFVMKNGSLVESGTHDELIAKQTEYARLYHTQKQWYLT